MRNEGALLGCLAAIAVGLWTLTGGLSFGARQSADVFLVGTLIMLGVSAITCWAWPRDVTSAAASSTSRATLPRIIVALAGVAVAAFACLRLLVPVFAARVNAMQADMLVVIDQGVDRFLHLSNPYTIYHLPWPVPLPYGPWLWLPFVVPHVLGMDPRILTLVGHLVVPGACIAAASACIGQRRFAVAIALLGVAALLLLHPAIAQFHVIGHTFVYWPLLLLFCWYVRGGRWTAAAVVCGCLVVARLTFVSIVPVFLLHLFVARKLSISRLLLLGAAAVLPFVPFAILDAHMVLNGLYGHYLTVMKDFVWASTNWAENSFGLTPVLLRHGRTGWIQPSQFVAMAIVYAIAFIGLRRGVRPEPLMGLALLVFSMTTPWPMIYFYFDVYLFLAATAACDALVDPIRGSSPWRLLSTLILASAALVLGTAAIRPGSTYALDIGSHAAASFTGGGFGQDVPVNDGERVFEWVHGSAARIRLPRAGWMGATLRIVARAPAGGGRVQRVAASLNGHALGIQVIGDGWTTIDFSAPRRDWYYGFNLLDLNFSYVAPAADPQDPEAAEGISAGIDTIEIR